MEQIRIRCTLISTKPTTSEEGFCGNYQSSMLDFSAGKAGKVV